MSRSTGLLQGPDILILQSDRCRCESRHTLTIHRADGQGDGWLPWCHGSVERLIGRPPRGGRFRPSLPCTLLGGDIRVVAPRSVDGRRPSRIHLHPAQRQHEHAECQQAIYPTTERRKHRLSICVTRAFRTAIAKTTWSAERPAVNPRSRHRCRGTKIYRSRGLRAPQVPRSRA